MGQWPWTLQFIYFTLLIPQPDTGYKPESLPSFSHSHKLNQPVARGQSVARDKVLCCSQKYERSETLLTFSIAKFRYDNEEILKNFEIFTGHK